MEMIDLSRVIYDGMPKIPILPDVHVRKFLSLEKGHPLNVTELSLPCHAGTHVDAPIHIVANGKSNPLGLSGVGRSTVMQSMPNILMPFLTIHSAASTDR